MFYKELHELCPDAKILLTIRDTPSVWAKSMITSIGPVLVYTNSVYHCVPSYLHRILPSLFPRMMATTCCGGSVRNWINQAWLVNEYENHIDEVKQSVKTESLVVFNVKQGWGYLTEELGINTSETDVKYTDFPYLNDGRTIRKGLKALKAIDTLTWITTILGILFLIYSIFEVSGT